MRGDDRGFRLALLAIVVLLAVAGGVRLVGGSEDGPDGGADGRAETDRRTPSATPSPGSPPATTPTPPPAPSPVAQEVLGDGRTLVAFYGTGGTGALGVLGETTPDVMHRRLLRAARPFARPGRPVRPVYELIVTVADRTPGPDGDYSHDVARSTVQTYLRAARRNGALLLLDVQPGQADFLDVARRWEWALKDPSVGLALDPEWRMYDGRVPGSVVGHVSAYEVNRTSQWLADLVRREGLPEKLLVLHQFRTDMLRTAEKVQARPGLQLVQHVDGFGTPSQKLATYATVARPGRFAMGFKLFYDEDVPRMSPADVLRVRPGVRFVSFQ